VKEDQTVLCGQTLTYKDLRNASLNLLGWDFFLKSSILRCLYLVVYKTPLINSTRKNQAHAEGNGAEKYSGKLEEKA